MILKLHKHAIVYRIFALDSSLLLAADLGNAKVMSAKQNPRIFAEEVIDDDTEDDNDENNENETKKSSFKRSHLLSTEEQEEFAGMNPAKKLKF